MRVLYGAAIASRPGPCGMRQLSRGYRLGIVRRGVSRLLICEIGLSSADRVSKPGRQHSH
jgi:hypothetical protein